MIWQLLADNSNTGILILSDMHVPGPVDG